MEYGLYIQEAIFMIDGQSYFIILLILSIWLNFIFLFIMIIKTLLIPDEEQKLEKIFGEQYKEYKNKVRQWI